MDPNQHFRGGAPGLKEQTVLAVSEEAGEETDTG